MNIQAKFPQQKAQSFLERFASTTERVHAKWDGSPDDEAADKSVEVMDGRDEVLMTFDRDGHLTSGSFEDSCLYYRADSGNGVTTYSVKGRGISESAVVADKTREVLDFQSSVPPSPVSLSESGPKGVGSEELPPARLSGSKLSTRAVEWLASNTDWGGDEDRLFPHPDSGNMGTEAHPLNGDSAQRAVDFAKAISLEHSIEFDKDTESVLKIAT